MSFIVKSLIFLLVIVFPKNNTILYNDVCVQCFVVENKIKQIGITTQSIRMMYKTAKSQ